jgi:hypothetical protein
MATIADLLRWIESDLGRFASMRSCLEVVEGPFGHVIRLYTDASCYTLHVGQARLMLAVNARKPRAGETTWRTRTLTEGPIDEATWRTVLGDILSAELVQLSPHAIAAMRRYEVPLQRASGGNPGFMDAREADAAVRERTTGAVA